MQNDAVLYYVLIQHRPVDVGQGTRPGVVFCVSTIKEEEIVMGHDGVEV